MNPEFSKPSTKPNKMKYKIGDKVRLTAAASSNHCDVSINKEYEIYRVLSGSSHPYCIVDDAGDDHRFAADELYSSGNAKVNEGIVVDTIQGKIIELYSDIATITNEINKLKQLEKELIDKSICKREEIRRLDQAIEILTK
jgi:hypothetical protein